MADIKSELIQAYENKERVRTTNYRGSLLCTSVYSDVALSNGDIFYISLIPFGATLKSVEVSFSTAVTGSFSLGIAGINQDGSYTEIEGALINRTGNTEKNIEMCDAEIRTVTIYEKLCDDTNKVPNDKFEPYSKDQYGVLFFKCGEGTTSTNIGINLEYVEPSPSFALMTKQSV